MEGKWLPPAKITESRRPVLFPGEVECFSLSAVDIEPDPEPSSGLSAYKAGLLILTTHRLIWIPESQYQPAAFVPLSLISHIFTMKKSLKSMFASPRVRFQLSVSHSGSRVDLAGSGSGSRSVVVTLVMRGKADNHELFLTRFWEAWRGRAWEASSSGSDAGGSPSAVAGIRMPMVGVAGILRREQETWENTDKSLQEAFQDLNALMSKAKEMVMLADKMRQKLLSASTNQPNAGNDEEMGSKEEMQDWLLSVGIISPVTKETAGALYHQQLSRQILLRFHLRELEE